MATVFLALDLALDRKVAIKVMSPALMSSPGAIDRFRREARVAAALSHPHIVPIHAIGQEPGIAYYVMKYIEGRTLDSVLRTEGRQDLAFAQAILGYVGGALHYAHQRGVVHRDVKPANIMLDREGWCYVTDFGIAKADDGAGLTKSGVIIGTPHYMCPEQFNGQPVTGAADQYALGVVAYELLTGAPPFGGPSIGEVMRGHLLEPVPPVRAVRPDVPEALEACVMRMMAKDPAERFPSVAEAVAAFGTINATMERDARAVIAELAERGAAAQPEVAVPTSPVPQRRPTVHHAVVSAPTTPMTNPALTAATREAALRPAVPAPAPARRRVVPVVAGLALLAAVGIGAWQWRASAWPRGTVAADTGDSAAPATPASQGVTPGAVPAESSTVVRIEQSPPRSLGAPDTSAGSVAGATVAPPPESPVSPGPGRRDPALGANRPRGGIRQRLENLNDRREAAGLPAVQAARVRIGSRLPLTFLFVNGNPRGAIGEKGLQNVPIAAGRVTLSIRRDNCQSWDTTFTAVADQLHPIGFRTPTC